MKERVFYFSALRVLACFAVIILHITASETILFQEVLTGPQTTAMTVLYNLNMWAVPCFVMVSGALLLSPERDISISKIFRVYIRRVLLALVLFSLLFRLFDIFMDGEALTIAGVLAGFKDVFTGSGWSHMWYLYLILGLYLILPFLRAVTAKCTDRELKYLVILAIVFFSVLPMTKLFGVAGGFYLHVNTVYPLYFFLGYMLHNKKIKLSPALAILFCVLGIFGSTAATVLGLKGVIQNATVLTGYSSIFVLMLSAGIFSLMGNIRTPGEKGQKVLSSIDQSSFGIYLIHMVFVRLVLRYLNFNLYDRPIVLSLPLTVIGIFLLSWLLSGTYLKIKTAINKR